MSKHLKIALVDDDIQGDDLARIRPAPRRSAARRAGALEGRENHRGGGRDKPLDRCWAIFVESCPFRGTVIYRVSVGVD